MLANLAFAIQLTPINQRVADGLHVIGQNGVNALSMYQGLQLIGQMFAR